MKKPLVSILIPVYNVAEYLHQCLDSVVNQTLDNIEIVIVNDCSPYPEDDKICKEYAEKDPRIKYIIHEENKGVGGARNTAIQNASADYIGWVDSDDWAELDMFEKLYNDIITNNSDISQCFFTDFTENGHNLRKLKGYRRKKDALNSLNVLLWNKLFKKDLFTKNDISFPNRISIDDIATMPRLFYFVNSVSRVKEALYHYRVKREGGVTANFERIMDEYFEVYSIIQEFLKKNNWWERDQLFFEKRVLRSLIHDVKRLYNDLDLDIKSKNEIIVSNMSKSLVFLRHPEKIDLSEIGKTKKTLESYKNRVQLKLTLQKIFNL